MGQNDQAYALTTWYRTALGQALAHSLQDELHRHELRIFGYYAAQLGLPEQRFWLDAIATRNKYYVVEAEMPTTSQINLLAPFTALPWQSKSMDCLVLPHTLSLATEITTILAEAERVLIPEGYLVIIDFNPISFWGMRAFLPGWNKQVPWNLAYPTLGHVTVQLGNLGMQIETIYHCFYRLPLASPRIIKNTILLEMIGQLAWVYPAACYLIIAKKTESTLTQIKPLFYFRDFVVGKRFAQPECRTQFPSKCPHSTVILPE